jgi:hypothetical protein
MERLINDRLPRLQSFTRDLVRSLLTPAGMCLSLRFTSIFSAAVGLVLWFLGLILYPKPLRLACGGLILATLVGLTLVFYFVSSETICRWRNRLHFTAEQWLWVTALSIDICFGIIGLVYIQFLFLFPSPVASAELNTWEFNDKRYVAALYLLGIGLTYLIGIIAVVLTRLRSEIPLSFRQNPAPVIPTRWSVVEISFWLRRAIAAIFIGAVLAAIYVGPHVSSVVARPDALNFHENMHLGSLQRIAQGAVPYVEARSLYGPGLQIVDYHMMRATEFTAEGFRLSFARVNAVAACLMFATFIFAFGWSVGLIAIGISQFISPLRIVDFVGWAYLFRWFGPLVVGALLPMLIWYPAPNKFRYFATVILGVTCGALAWYAQENGVLTILTAALIFMAGVIQERVSIRQAALLSSLFIGAQVLVFILLFAYTVGLANLQHGLALYFRGPNLVSSGISNTYWSEALRPFGIGYYLTPYVVIAITALALYSRGRLANENGRGALIGTAAAAAALTCLTLFRADRSHFLGPSAAIAPLLALSVVHLPGLLSIQVWRREMIRCILIITFFFIYPFPKRPENFLSALTPNVHEAVDAVRVLQQGRPDLGRSTLPGAGLLDSRLGFSLDPDKFCTSDATCADFDKVVEEVHRAVNGRAVLVDAIPETFPRYLYFFADLRVGTSFTAPEMSLWVDQDFEELKAELRVHPPECVVTSDRNRPQTRLVFPERGHYTEVKLLTKINVFVLCSK